MQDKTITFFPGKDVSFGLLTMYRKEKCLRNNAKTFMQLMSAFLKNKIKCAKTPHNSCSHGSLLKTGDILTPKSLPMCFPEGCANARVMHNHTKPQYKMLFSKRDRRKFCAI